jgi:hypothetical protein
MFEGLVIQEKIAGLTFEGLVIQEKKSPCGG